MKKILVISILLIAGKSLFSQNVGINTSGAVADPSSLLDVDATNKGILVPRVALTNITDAVTITTPATSLLVYNTATAGGVPNNVVPGYYYNSGTSGAPVWARLATGNGSAWQLLGNAGTVAATNFLGTTDAIDLVFRTNNTEKMRIQSGGNVLIGTAINTAKVNIVSTAGGAPNTSTMYIAGPGGNGFGTSGIVDVFDNQGTPAREATLGYSTGPPYYGMLNLLGTGTNTRMGEFDFMNRALQPADARIATITANTGAVNNSGSLEFITRNAGTFISNVLWLNFDGKVGIMTPTPLFNLHVRSTTNLCDTRVESTDYVKFSLNSSAATADNKKWQMYAVNSVGNELRFGCLNDAETVENLWLRVIRTGNMPTNIIFPLGNVGIGTTAPAEKLEVCGNLKVVGTITAQGAIATNGAIVCSSDLRFKKDITPLQNSLDKVISLRGVNYSFRTEEFPDRNFSSTPQIGFVAQEIEKIYPEFVVTDQAGFKSVDYSRLTPVLVEAVKEQQVLINEQKLITDKLVLENAAMKKDIEDLKLLLGNNNQVKTNSAEIGK